jgi:amino acid adenylation domain-containing protein
VKFDLTLNFRTSADGVTLGLEYDRDLFDGSTAQRLLRSVRSLLGGIAEDPGRRADTLLLFGSAERHQLLREWNDTEREDPGAGGLERLFDAQVERTPEAVAVDSEDRQLSYRELRRRAARVARRLRGLGVGPDCRVGLCLERSTELVVGMVGILRAGGAYVPLDPSYPAARLAFMVQDAKAPVLVTSRAQLAGLPRDGARVVSLDEEPASGSGDAPGVVVAGCAAAAYVLYTSGSTGRPKGVVISRGALANHMRWMQEDLPLAAGDRVLQKTPFSFDASVWEFWAPLLAGARLVMASPGGHQDSRYLVEVIREKGITVLQGVPLLLRALLEHPTFRHCRTLRRVFSGGEPLTADLRDRFAAAGPEVPLFNLYGPTETTVQCSYERCGAGGVLRDAPLGRPIHNVRLHVLSRGSSPAAAGGIGELHVGGGGVGRGYLRRPALTAERFVPDPLSGVAGARLYRTADLARWLSDGRLEFLRRIDGQVKVRGFRIELGEVEAVLASCAGVRACAVAVREDQPGIRRLVAYVEAGGEVSTAHLREQLKERLPDYMVPSALERVEALPATPSCKLDRKALLAPEWAPAPGDQRPATLVEQVLAGLWSDLLGVEGVEPEDDFFGLGGHSLLAGRLTARIADVLKVRLPLGTVFEAPTVAALAARVADARGAPLPSIRPVPRRGDLPLSFGQERLWFVHQLRPSSAAYNIAAALRIDGNLVESALELSLRAVVERHESLRTVFPSIGDRPVQRLLEEPFALSRVDLKGLPEAVRDRELGCQVHSAARRPFDLTRGPLLRCSLLGVSEGRWVLVVVLHHIVGDAWSMDVLTREVTALYTAFVEGPSELAAPGIRRDGILSALPIQYADLASWQREHLGPEALAPGIAYWRDRLEGAPEVMRLPIDGPSPTLSSPASGREGLVLESAVCEELRRLGREEGATLFMALLAAFQAQLFFYTKQPDVVVGTPAAMRHRSELEGLIGFLVNTLVLRTDLSGDPSFRELLVRVRDGVVAAYDHQDVPFEYLVQILRPQRSASRSPLYQVWFVLHEAPSKGLELPGVAVTPLGTDVAEARHDLQLDLTRSEAEIEGALIYRRNLFRQETVSRMAREFSALVSGIVARPDARLSQLEDALRAAEQRWQHAAKSRFSQLRRRELSGLKGLRRRQVAGPPQG